MPRRKSTPSKRPLDAPPSQPSASKRSKRCKQPRPPSLHQHREPLPLSRATTGDAEDALRLQLPVHSRLLPSLAAVCNDEHALQLQIDLTLSETAQLQLHLHGQSPSAAHAPVALAELFPHTCEAFRPHVATLAERGLLSLHINAHRTSECDDWSFTLAVRVAWREYMTLCSSRGLLPGSAAPRAAPMRAMHHMMIWLLKQTHDAERGLSEVEKSCSFRYWSEIELLCARCVGDSSAMCEQFQGRTFAMPEIYARIDAARQLRRDISEYEAAEAASTDLLPTLRPYQKAAVAWMLSREKTTSQQGCTLLLGVTFKEETARDVQAYDPFCAVFHTVGRPQVHQEQLRPIGMDLASVRGGILADEMGLGKTVEVIALVLSRRKPLSRPQLLSMHSCVETDEDTDVTDDTVACICGSSENHPMGFVQCEFCGTWHHQLCTGYMVHASGEGSESSSATSLDGIWDFESSDSAESGATSTWSSGGFMCYHCQSQERPSFATRTTLIVSPEPIHAQWEHEFSRHVREGALSVMRYPGVRALRTRLEGTGPSAEWQVLASPGLVLARYDVVLTTYEALGADLRHVPTTEGEDRRSSTRSQRKRYAFVGSPLVALRFWRVCMDEAQVGVENTRLQAALTLARLSADNRWVVTGTPFSSRVSELFGYLRFLRISPYASMQVETSQNLQLLQAENDEQEGADLCFFRESIERNFAEGAIDRVLDLLLWSGQDSQPAACGGGILWRTGKKHVLDQLNLPPQNSEVVWCQFAAVERHFYDQQEKRIISLVQQRQRRQSEQTSDVIAREDRLWQDLLILRQLCCHPQVGGARQAWGSGGNSTGGAVMTMDAFLQELLNKATRECEDAQRQLIGAQNGLAGLLVLDDDISGAALKYMAQMSLIRKNWSHFRADLLPRLHILQNLQKCVQQLYTLPDGDVGAESTDVNANPKRECLLPELPALEERISSTGLLPGSADLRNEDLLAIKRECSLLGDSARQIRQFYLLQVDMKHTQALDNFRQVFKEIDEGQHSPSRAKSEMLCTSGDWWSDALAIIENSGREGDQQLVARVQARLFGFGTRWGTTFCSQLVSTRSLRLLLVRELEALAKRRRVLLERLAALSDGPPSDADIELSGNCAKCRDGGTGPMCVHCQLYKELGAYRQHFLGIDKTSPGKTHIMHLLNGDDGSMEGDDNTAATRSSGGGSSVSLFVEVFKEISGCARNALRSQPAGKGRANNIQTEMQSETEFWTKLQREWLAAKKLFQAQHQRLGALDELVMACSQLRLRQPGEPAARTKAERLYKLERVEVPVREAELEAERTAADLDLRSKMAQLRYFLQLQGEADARHVEYSQQNGTSPSARPLCAVCLQEFTQRRAVLPCAHAFCTTCISSLTGGPQHPRKTVRCPTCRRISRADSVTVVVEAEESTADSTSTLSERQNETVSGIPHQPTPPGGSLGSKLDALLARVDMLRQENPGVKCLLFSQWSRMLELTVRSLPRLGVRCFMYDTKRQLPKLLTQFQACPAACVLALPFKVGANGLNIVEATEVLLIEPLLSTSIEAQAVNRVHRLGQTRRTRVHRFIVRGSVEERIYRLGHKQKTGNSGAELSVGEEKEEDDDGLQRLGVAPGRKEQEKLTMQDLQNLLHGNSNSGEQHAQAVAAFWDESVVLNGKTVSRRAACAFLERRHATRVREENQTQFTEDQEPHTTLFDKAIALLVAEELLTLSYPLNENDVEVVERVDPQILQHHHDRINEEMRVWKAAHGDM
ncbi:hypothetical protein PF008_g1301 [Phytophthora fragariae]|uniref:RING-type domain-containing protein n=1 Tax=Phytophthora fragariae TaxID=53985 RepID=A0A6G0SKE8_9STRA|nr:hypothetical protein PF008_g1301 [Phytophthora fragariae]